MSASHCSLVILRPADLARVYIAAKAGDPESMLMLKLVEKGMSSLEEGQRCMLCDHKFPDFRDVAVYVVIEPIAGPETPSEVIFFGLCDRCEEQGELQGRVISHLKDRMWPNLAVVGSTEVHGTA